MVYTSTITTAANTAQASPLKTTVRVTVGMLYQFEVYFPPGPSGLVGVQIRYKNVQLYPVQRDEWFIGDNVTISFEDIYELSAAPFDLDVLSYNLDTEYNHLVQVRIGLQTVEEFAAKTGALGDIEKLTTLLADIESRTAAANAMSVDEARSVVSGSLGSE